MIYCPKCGTANRDGSRFCNECGQTLGGPTRVKCARCGALNPVQSAFCSECGGQLLSSSGEGQGAEAAPTIKGLSLPTKEPAGQAEPGLAESESTGSEEEVPAWLRELGAAQASEGESETASQGEDQADVPDWLQDLRASFPIEDEAAPPSAPHWLTRMRPTAEGQPPADFPESQAEELPDWLAQIRFPSGAETFEPPAAPEAEEEDIPVWLAELSPLAAEEAPEPALTEEEESLPDWLAELRPTDSPEAAEAEEKEVPAGLAELRPAVSTEAAEPAPPEAEADEEDIPAWLAELRLTASAEAAEAAPPETEADEESIPAWLAELPSATGAEAAEPAPPETEADEESIPAWLAELRSATGAETTEPAPPETEADEESIPAWLAELRSAAGAEAAEPIPPETEAHEEGIPAWLAELRPAAGAEARETAPPEAEAHEEGIPAWLAEQRPAASAVAPAAQEELPSWLAGLRPDGTAEAPEPAPPEAEEEAGDGEASGPALQPEAKKGAPPDWLPALRPEPTVKESAPSPPAEEGQPEEETLPHWLVQVPTGQEAAESEEIAAAEKPGWLQAIEPAGLETQAGPPVDQDAGGSLPAWLVPAARQAEDESLARAEIPGWLMALKPVELRDRGEPAGPSPVSVEPMEETGLLAGLRGTLPVEMLIAQPRAVVAAEPPPVIPRDTPQARLFAEIVGRGPEAAPKAAAQPRQSRLTPLPLLITYLALLGAITLPLLLQDPLFKRSVEAPASVLELYESVEALDPGRPALVAFDYDPSNSEELNVLARVVVGHLLDRGIPVVAVSLQPAGPPVAQSVLEELTAGRPGLLQANVGYLSGQAAAVQLLDQGLAPTLHQDFQGLTPAAMEIVRGVTGFESFGLVLVLAAEPESLRIWIEQAGTLQGAPLAAAVSASTEPLARSYYETNPRQLLGLVAGVPGAAMYEALRRGDGTLSAEMAARLDSHLAGHAVLVLVLVVGNLAYLVRRGPRGRR
jgi:hypothetical protein